VEPDGTGSNEIGVDLDRIEAAVKAGSFDLRALGFWRVVARVKTDRALVVAHADRIARIDTAAFRGSVRFRIPVWVGNLLLASGALAGVAALVVAAALENGTVVGVLAVGTGLAWAVAFHSPTHWLVGWLGGIGFTDYFLGTEFPPRPGLKIDYSTYLRAEPNMRAWMHASGAIATKLAPFLALALAPRATTPWWAATALAVFGVVQVVTDALFSVKRADWKRFLREREIARSMNGA
jgi:hypothetical protein